MKWEPTCELRFEIRGSVEGPHILQQMWRKPTFGVHGHLSGYDLEWRDVPFVMKENK